MGGGAIVLNRNGSRTLIVPPFWDGDRVSDHAEGIRVVATDDFAYTVTDELKGKRGVPRQIGVAGLKLMAQRIAGPTRAALANRRQQMDDFMAGAVMGRT